MKDTMTELSKQYDPEAAQNRWAPFWEEHQFFHSQPRSESSSDSADKRPYTIVIPPPNVTGALHLGHALNNTLQDILIRMKRMQGYETLWMPGVDHAGIATQAVVERKLFEDEKKTRHDIGREALVERIWQWKEQYQNRIISQLKAFGCSCDWQRTRFTLDRVCAKAVRHFFFKLFGDDLVYRGKKLVNWDTHLQTAVSDDEVFHETVAGNFWHLKYPVIDPLPGDPMFVMVATTRPETMLGDTAVAIHPNPEKYLDNLQAELMAKLRTASEKEIPELQNSLEDVMSRKMSAFLTNYKRLVQMAKEGRHVMLPLVNRPIPLVLDDWAKPNLGSGCVKITPAHDPNDYEVGLRQGLPMINLLNKDGTLNEHAGSFVGLKIAEARKKVVAEMESLGLLAEVEDRQIEIAHSDRSKTAIEPFLNDQWYVRMDTLAQSAIDAVETETLKFIPSRYTKGYVDWLSEKRDWPIGRQLWWGHRIPIWYCSGVTESELQAAFKDRRDVLWRRDEADETTDTWWICSEEVDLPPDIVPGHTLTQEEDVLDTWFSSALWPLSTLGWPDESPELSYYYPTTTLVTSRDIITLWVARMVLAGQYLRGVIPFHEVYITPKVLDKFGEGMSKSKGNGIDPVDVIEKFGADALRFALAQLTTETQDIRLTVDFECPHCQSHVEQTKKNRILPRIDCPKCKKPFRTQWAATPEDKSLPLGPAVGERFEVARNFCNKLWNAARFVLSNLDGATNVSSGNDINDVPLPADCACATSAALSTSSNSSPQTSAYLEDRWILSRLSQVTKQVPELLSQYRYSDAARTLYDFAWDDFCSFYLEMTKERLHSADTATRSEVLRMLVHVLDVLIRLLHPFIPFVTEEIWQRLIEAGIRPGTTSTHGEPSAVSICVAAWPEPDDSAVDVSVEEQFTVFQELLRGIREIRASRNVPPKTSISFAVRCDSKTAALLQPLSPYFHRMAGAVATSWGEAAVIPPLHSALALSGMDVFVDLADLIDIPAELAKKEAELAKLAGFIAGKEAKLASDFVDKAPAAVVQKERESLEDLKKQYESTLAAKQQLLECLAKV